MNLMRWLWYYVWVAPHVLSGAILWLMVRRQLYRQFPVFLLYNLSEILQFAVLFTVSVSHRNFGKEYFGFYSAGLALSAAVRFGVIHELFLHFFRRYPSLHGPGKFVLRGSIVLLLLVALGLAVSAPGNRADFFLNTVYRLNRVAAILQSGLLISLFLFSRYFVLSWRSPAFGIALGLGIFASVDLAMSGMRLYGLVSGTVFDFVIMGSYHCCALIWMFYLLVPERQARVARTLPEHNLDLWNRELQRMLQQ